MSIQYTEIKWNRKKIILGKTETQNYNHLHLLVGFHGAESTPENILVHGNYLSNTKTVFAYPEGPFNTGKCRFSWWKDGPKQKETVETFLQYSTELIQYIYSQLKEENPETNYSTSLWGFSQGAAAALVYALLGQHPIHKVASVCGFLPDIPERKQEKNSRAQILGIFGNKDPIVPSFLAEYALEKMKNHGHKSEIVETTQGHELNFENLKTINAFFYD